VGQQETGTEEIANAELMATSQFSLPFMYSRLKDSSFQSPLLLAVKYIASDR